MNCRGCRQRFLPLPDLSRKIEGDFVRRLYAAMKMLERKLLFVLISVPWFFTDSVSIKLERILFEDYSIRISRTETRNVQFFHLCLFQ